MNDVACIFYAVSVAYKFHVERGAGPREAIDYWKDHLTCVRIYKYKNAYTQHTIVP